LLVAEHNAVFAAVKKVYVRGGGADVGELPLEVLLQRLEALEGDLELVGSIEGRGVVPHGDVEQAHCRWSVIVVRWGII
jgi:hypothetical protein